MKWEDFKKATEKKETLFDRQIKLDTAYRSEIIYMSLSEEQVKILEDALKKIKSIK